MEANNNNDENHDHDQQEQQADDNAANDDDENEEEDAIAAAVLLKLHTILHRRKDFTLRQRNKIVELAEEYIEGLGNDIHDMLCDQNHGENYHGLDSNRDTEAEVETALQFYPNLLSRRKDVRWDDEEDEWINAEDGEGEYPIQCLLELCGPNGCHYNFKAIPFIAILGLSGIRLDQFEEEEERGGLLIEDRYEWNTLQELVRSSSYSDEEELNQRVDIVFHTQFIQLRRMNLFIQADIQEYELVHNLCITYHFPERRFQFLVEMDPSSLVHIDEYGSLPLHYAAQISTIEGFQIVFQYVIRYYPNKKGITILFTKNNRSKTPFQIACEKHGRDVVMRIVENTLNSSDIPINTVEALVMAAINGNIHFDCSYLLLRREPDLLVRLLSGPNTNSNDDGSGGSGGGGNLNYGNDDDDDDDHVDDIDVDEDNADDDREDMSDANATDGAVGAADNDDDDDRNYSSSDIVCNNMNKVEEGDSDDDDDDEMRDGTHNNEVVSRKRKR